MQGALPRALTPIQGSADAISLSSFLEKYMTLLRTNAALCVSLLEDCPHVDVLQPKGAMYAMIRINFSLLDGTMEDDAIFSQRLLAEENLIILPGQCFGMPGYARIVTCPPADVLTEALSRVKAFLGRHGKREEEVEVASVDNSSSA